MKSRKLNSKGNQQVTVNQNVPTTAWSYIKTLLFMGILFSLVSRTNQALCVATEKSLANEEYYDFAKALEAAFDSLRTTHSTQSDLINSCYEKVVFVNSQVPNFEGFHFDYGTLHLNHPLDGTIPFRPDTNWMAKELFVALKPVSKTIDPITLLHECRHVFDQYIRTIEATLIHVGNNLKTYGPNALMLLDYVVKYQTGVLDYLLQENNMLAQMIRMPATKATLDHWLNDTYKDKPVVQQNINTYREIISQFNKLPDAYMEEYGIVPQFNSSTDAFDRQLFMAFRELVLILNKFKPGINTAQLNLKNILAKWPNIDQKLVEHTIYQAINDIVEAYAYIGQFPDKFMENIYPGFLNSQRNYYNSLLDAIKDLIGEETLNKVIKDYRAKYPYDQEEQKFYETSVTDCNSFISQVETQRAEKSKSKEL